MDGVQVKDLESTFKVKVDGIRQFYTVDLDPETKVISCEDFEVPKEWTEIKFFYESTCVWTVHQEDVKTEEYVMNPMFDDYISMESTKEGDTIYNEKYEIIYQGYTFHTEKNIVWGDKEYVIFKYTINNTSDAVIDYNTAGHEMRAYQNGYSLGDASYSIEDSIDGYLNVFSVDSIEKGMTANVYVAFQVDNHDGNFYMAYDDGYISNDLKGFVFVNQKTEDVEQEEEKQEE